MKLVAVIFFVKTSAREWGGWGSVWDADGAPSNLASEAPAPFSFA